MPYPLIPTALAVCFLLMWLFIGGMMFRDGQIAARRDRELETSLGPVSRSATSGAAWHVKNRTRRRRTQTAS